MIDTRLIGPKDDQYAVLSLGTVWLATTKKPYAEAVSAAVAAAIAGGGATDALPSEMGTIPAAETPITQALVSMLEAGWLSLGSSAPGAVKPLVETMERMEREVIDLKQRLLPQFAGRTQKAEHERDALLEELIVRRTAIANLHGEINEMREKLRAATTMPCAPSATGEPVAWMYEENGERMFGHSDGYRPKDAVPLYAGSPPVEEKAIGHARYEYLRTLNPRKFAALYNEALMGVHQFDDLVDRYRMKKEQSNQQGILDGSHHDASRPSPTTKEQP